MTTRDQIVRTALGFNGTCNGKGYNGPNPFSADLRRPAEAWCGDFVKGVPVRGRWVCVKYLRQIPGPGIVLVSDN